MVRCLVLIGSLLAGQAGTPADKDLQTEVPRLVRQLDAPQLAERESAEAGLLRRGPAVLELLPTPDQRMSAEVRQRLGRIRQKLQQARADAAANNSTVTLHADAMRLSDILGTLQKQSGNAIVDYRPRFGQLAPDPKLTIQFNHTPFWAALDQVCGQAGLALYPYVERRAIGVVAAAENRLVGPVSYSGPFRVEPVEIVARRDLRWKDGAWLVVTIEVAWEPRIRVISLTQPMDRVSAVDERGNPLPVVDSKAVPEALVDGKNTAVKMNVPLRLPSRDVREITSLKGTLQATIAGKHETFRFDALTKEGKQQQRIAHTRVTLRKVRKNGQAWEIQIEVRFDDAADALASHRQWIFENQAYLQGPDGKPIPYDSYETKAQGRRDLGMAYQFTTNRPLSDLTFVYKTPGAIIVKSIDYHLKDIRLP